jgi:hypothetical protein
MCIDCNKKGETEWYAIYFESRLCVMKCGKQRHSTLFGGVSTAMCVECNEKADTEWHSAYIDSRRCEMGCGKQRQTITCNGLVTTMCVDCSEKGNPAWHVAYLESRLCVTGCGNQKATGIYGGVTTMMCITCAKKDDTGWYSAHRDLTRCVTGCGKQRCSNVCNGMLTTMCVACSEIYNPEWYTAYRASRDCYGCGTMGQVFPDGIRRCMGCAVKDGTVKDVSRLRTSKVASRFLNKVVGDPTFGIVDLQFICIDPITFDVTGSEKKGLIKGRNYEPDGYDEATKTVWLYHGNEWHGYPPDHPKYDNTSTLTHTKYSSKYETTAESMDAYKDAGYTVKYVWQHEYTRTELKRNPTRLVDVVRTW